MKRDFSASGNSNFPGKPAQSVQADPGRNLLLLVDFLSFKGQL